MDLVTVGTGTVAPSATRTSACHWVGRGNLKILLDCGAGALHHLAQFGLPWHQVTHVVLSHFHPDHWGELPMLVYALKYTTAPPRQEPLVILGPRGVVRLVKQLAEGYGPWLLDPGFPIGILDVQAGEPFPLDAEVSLETHPVPVVPLALQNLWGSFFSRIERGEAMVKPFRRGLFSRVGLVAGEAVAAPQVSPEGLRERVGALLAAG